MLGLIVAVSMFVQAASAAYDRYETAMHEPVPGKFSHIANCSLLTLQTLDSMVHEFNGPADTMGEPRKVNSIALSSIARPFADYGDSCVPTKGIVDGNILILAGQLDADAAGGCRLAQQPCKAAYKARAIARWRAVLADPANNNAFEGVRKSIKQVESL
jgi:hypothetical protein